MPRDEGNSGSDGVVVSLTLVGDGTYESIYTIPIQVGASRQAFSVQVDTGSSDLWLASKSCSSPSCSNTKSHEYDPSAALASSVDFQIQYLAGAVSGPIYWDQLDIGGYSVGNQALAAADTVDSEPLDNGFNGVLGLALPPNSVIQKDIPPTDGDAPDGAAFSANLFGITPAEDAPPFRFFSLALERPGVAGVPSVMGIGRHPSSLVSDPSKITYSPVIRSFYGAYFWQSSVRDITVYVNSQPKVISLGRSLSGSAFPVAVLDTGVPYILTTTAIANAIYGALGIGPGSDGQYYLPCTTPLNMSITLEGQNPQPLHPLDLTAVSCIGIIQTASGALDHASGTFSDIILGVPFLRNAYTVLAYDVPDASGAFPPTSNTTDTTHPQIGILSLTNITQALDEFNTVRVLKQPLSTGGGGTSNSSTSSDGKGGLSVGLKVLFGLLGFVALCILLFGARWFFVRRRWRRAQAGGGFDGDNKDAYLGPRGQRDGDVSLHMALAGYHQRKEVGSSYTTDSGRTHVGSEDLNEFGKRGKETESEPEGPSFLNLDPWDTSGWRHTLVEDNSDPDMTLHNERGAARPTASHHHSASDVNGNTRDGPGVAEPLLAHTRDATHSLGLEDSGGDFELGLMEGGTRTSMAGVGTAARGSRISVDGRHSAYGSVSGDSVRRSLSPRPGRAISPLGPRFPAIIPPVVPEWEQPYHGGRSSITWIELSNRDHSSLTPGARPLRL
ncbi:aspartic peptidase domain-containing protein [Amylostereum chailletii]|nr:aspartic peptidase domain-containing protein [Amylostereum chailletii]